MVHNPSILPSFEKLMRDIQALSSVGRKNHWKRIPRLCLHYGFSHTKEQVLEKGPVGGLPFQGERGAYSELAIQRAFDESTKVSSMYRFLQMSLRQSWKGKASYGMISHGEYLGWYAV